MVCNLCHMHSLGWFAPEESRECNSSSYQIIGSQGEELLCLRSDNGLEKAGHRILEGLESKRVVLLGEQARVELWENERVALWESKRVTEFWLDLSG